MIRFAKSAWLQRLRSVGSNNLYMARLLLPVRIKGIGREYRRALLHFVAHIVLQPIGTYNLFVFYRKDLRDFLIPVSARIPIRVTQATQADFREMIALRADYSEEQLHERLQSGEKCFLARVGNRVIGLNWITTSRRTEPFFVFSPERGDAYCFDAFTAEEFRGYSVHTELLYRMLVDSQMLGCKFAYTYVAALNVSSWKAHCRLGWDELGSQLTFFPRWRRGLYRASTNTFPKIPGSPIYFPPQTWGVILDRFEYMR